MGVVWNPGWRCHGFLPLSFQWLEEGGDEEVVPARRDALLFWIRMEGRLSVPLDYAGATSPSRSMRMGRRRGRRYGVPSTSKLV